MKAGGGKAKGSQFEREVCVTLSKWLSNGAKEDVLWRSAMSGGRATVAAKRGKRLSSQVGDISCIHPIGNRFISEFAIECKYYADLDFKGLITGKGKLLEFWEEISKQADTHGKCPFLVARQNRIKPVVCLAHNGLTKLGLWPSNTILISRPYDLYILSFEHFVKKCVPF